MHCIERPVGDDTQPFTIRMLSFDNLLAPPTDTYCPVVTNGYVEEGGGDGGAVQVFVGTVSPEAQFTVAERFNGHKVCCTLMFPVPPLYL
jgi:hypothetical protein